MGERIGEFSIDSDLFSLKAIFVSSVILLRREQKFISVFSFALSCLKI